MRCARDVTLAKGSWEGDIRSDNLYVFGLPYPALTTTRIGLVWKQHNNGTSFVCSPLEIPWLKEYEIGAPE